jgi:hypothetical protein
MAAACGSDTRIVDQYFGAVNAGDNQTLTSFAMVPFKEKVEKWSVTGSSPETRSPAVLPGLVAQGKKLESDLAANKKEAGAYSLAHGDEYNRFMEATRKGGKIPPNLQKFAADWARFEQNDRDLKKQIAENKAVVERERRNTQLSVGQNPDVDAMTGEMVDKTLALALTIKGQVKNYAMGLRKYELTGGANQGRTMSRWVVQTLQPK